MILQQGDTILIHAVKADQYQIVKLLLKKYSDVNVEGEVCILAYCIVCCLSKVNSLSLFAEVNEGRLMLRYSKL